MKQKKKSKKANHKKKKGNTRAQKLKKRLRIFGKELIKIGSTAGLINQSNAERDHY